MKLAFFQGCNIPIRIEQYAVSAETVLKKLGVELEIVEEFTCCGYPVRNVDEKAYIIPSVRNMAIAEKKGLDIMVICNCCFASLQKARSVMANNPELAVEINEILAKDGLKFEGTGTVKHFLTVLHEDIGLEAIKKQLVNMVSELNLSVIHGCHILRPREVTLFDDSFVPRITDELIALTGATSLDWRLEQRTFPDPAPGEDRRSPRCRSPVRHSGLLLLPSAVRHHPAEHERAAAGSGCTAGAAASSIARPLPRNR